MSKCDLNDLYTTYFLSEDETITHSVEPDEIYSARNVRLDVCINN